MSVKFAAALTTVLLSAILTECGYPTQNGPGKCASPCVEKPGIERTFALIQNNQAVCSIVLPTETLVSSFELLADGKSVFRTESNHQRLVRIPLNIRARKLVLRVCGFAGGEETGGVFSFDVR